MVNSNNGDDHGSYEGDSSLPVASGPIIPPTYPTLVDVNVPGLDLAPGVNAPAPVPALDQVAVPYILNPLFYEQLCQFIM
ncbi:UNVERIFIED_CONTAM: hypothetical protein Sradi_4916800 [Sesamum radiatum]|uniref:Uncharacterized protein n=1 Tax=Sesamum radiatum TaxID=300843 RepID=A0AAW2MFK7_SESRA